MSEPSEMEPTELWTPPTPLQANVGRMAWALLVIEVKGFCEKGSIADYPVERFESTYHHCIAVARALEEINKDPGQ